MSNRIKLGASALVLAMGLAAPAARAEEGQNKGSGSGDRDMPNQGHIQGQKDKGSGQSYGAGVGGDQQQQQMDQQGRSGQQQQGANAIAPIPQYWVADAALFIGNAANTAHVIDLERGLNVPSPAVLGNQASFLLAATNRALTSLMALQQHAEATNPKAVD